MHESRLDHRPEGGGAGKTTLSIAIACAATAGGLSTVIVDLDPQATAASWGDRRDSKTPPVISAQPPRLSRILDAAADQAVELAVIDSAPRMEQSVVAAAKAADQIWSSFHAARRSTTLKRCSPPLS